LNPKIDKLAREIEKTRDRIAELQSRLKDLEAQKIELENTDIVAIVRSVNLTPAQLAAFVRRLEQDPAADPMPEDTAHES